MPSAHEQTTSQSLRQSWVARLSETIERAPGPVIVVAHNLGCITTTHLPTEVAQRIQGAVVVGPIARLELLPVDAPAPGGHDPLIEARMSADRFRELGFQEGDTLVVSPKKARGVCSCRRKLSERRPGQPAAQFLRRLHRVSHADAGGVFMRRA